MKLLYGLLICLFAPCAFAASPATFLGASQLATCTGNLATDSATVQAAASAAGLSGTGGSVLQTAACVFKSTVTVPSTVLYDSQHYWVRPAAASNWIGGAIAQAFVCAPGGHDITWQNGYYDWTGAAVSVKVIACNGEVSNTSFSNLSFYNNTFKYAPGDAIALVHVTGAKIIGNKFYQPLVAPSAGAEVDAWDMDFDIEEANNSFYVTTQGIGSIITGFAQKSTATNIRNFNIHNNYYELISSSNGPAIAFYNQGYESGPCVPGVTDASQNLFVNNIIKVDAGVNGIIFRADYCSSFIRAAGNIFYGDGVTVATHPAFEVDGGLGMGVGIEIEDNTCVNFLAPASGTPDGGVFANKGTYGFIVNNKGFGCGTLANLVGTYNVQPSTITSPNYAGSGK
jgi:hypothetical protein